MKDIKVEQNCLDEINATENSSSTEKSKGYITITQLVVENKN